MLLQPFYVPCKSQQTSEATSGGREGVGLIKNTTAPKEGGSGRGGGHLVNQGFIELELLLFLSPLCIVAPAEKTCHSQIPY